MDEIHSTIEPSGLDSHSLKSRKRHRGSNKWKVIDSCNMHNSEQVPSRLDGFLLKKRNWPLKGWHKRYFIVDNGSLTYYARKPIDLAPAKPHGTFNLALSKISVKRHKHRIEIDADLFICHIRVKSQDMFSEWIDALIDHRQYGIIRDRRDDGVGAPRLDAFNKVPSRICSLVSDDSEDLEQLNDELIGVQDKLHHLRKLAGPRGMISAAAAELEPAGQDFLSAAEDLVQSVTCALRLLNREKERLKLAAETMAAETNTLSRSEFFDANDHLSDAPLTDFSSDKSQAAMDAGDEAEQEASVEEASETGDQVDDYSEPAEKLPIACSTGGRTKLPAPKASMPDLSLWNLMKRNKDVSKVSLPVALNEPLSMLQRLCEDLEYSELLDRASETEDPFKRMVLVAAFAVSAYGSSHLRAYKAFNPLLGETFECVRQDKGFRYISEQVSHHPAISVCHATSANFEFWQDVQIKTDRNLLRKSMELRPRGAVNVRLGRYNDHYQWNKVTTCVHNIFSDERSVDQYGELCITNDNLGIQCKLNFAKASFWSAAKRHEVSGTITARDGTVVHHLFGRWSEGLYCAKAPSSAKCVWRPRPLPDDHELYYGFSTFAIELNDLQAGLEATLPPTDSRLRPDQRLLEQGDVAGAEASKLLLEQRQRERRLKKESQGLQHRPKWFRRADGCAGEEKWQYAGTYWQSRSNSFADCTDIEPLW